MRNICVRKMKEPDPEIYDIEIVIDSPTLPLDAFASDALAVHLTGSPCICILTPKSKPNEKSKIKPIASRSMATPVPAKKETHTDQISLFPDQGPDNKEARNI